MTERQKLYLAGCWQVREGPDPGELSTWGLPEGLCLELCPSCRLYVLNQGEITESFGSRWREHCWSAEVSSEDVVCPSSLLMEDRLLLGVGRKKHSLGGWNPKAPRGGPGILGSVLRLVRKLCSY